MQHTQRKLQRSVTEMRRSCICRPRVSASSPPAKGGAAVRPEAIAMTFLIMVFSKEKHSRQRYSAGHAGGVKEAENARRGADAAPRARQPLAKRSLGARGRARGLRKRSRPAADRRRRNDPAVDLSGLRD